MLRTLEEEYRARRKILVKQGDCNDYLKSLVRNPRISWKEWRGVVFLDPFGMHVPWSTIARIAETHALEVFLNFPVGMAIQRLLKRSGQFADREREKLDNYFGDPGWFNVVYPQRAGLFGTERLKAEDAAQNLVQWYQRRLKNAFGHASRPYLVRNTANGHLYYLMFAGPNKTGNKIADHVLKGGEKI
jgi:three-Cys-motif partner protein